MKWTKALFLTILITPFIVSGCSTGPVYTPAEDQPTSLLVITPFAERHNRMNSQFELYHVELRETCSKLERIPISSNPLSTESNRSHRLQAGKRTLYLKHLATTVYPQHACRLLVEFESSPGDTHELEFIHPDPSQCDVSLLVNGEKATSASITRVNRQVAERLEICPDGAFRTK